MRGRPFAFTMTIMRRLLRPLWFLAAVAFLVEGWLWSHLAAAVARLVRLVSWPTLRARLAAFIERLSPGATLLVFLIPAVLLLPLKLLGFWLLARGSWLGAVVVLGLAKVVSMGVTAFIFQLTRPKLLQLGWFRWLHDRVVAGLAWAHRQIDPWKERVRAWARQAVRPAIERLRAWRARGKGRLSRRLQRLRRRAQRDPASR
jgi:hypothetical protein